MSFYYNSYINAIWLRVDLTKGDSHTLLFHAAFSSFLIFLSILTLCVIALFTPFVLTGFFCDSDVTPSFQP